MSYATITDVQDLIAQFPITTTSKPNTTQVTAIIADTSNEIDVRLSGAGFAVPVTTPGFFLAWLKRLNAYGAAAAVLKSMFPDAVGPGDTPAYAFWEERYQAGLKAITDGTVSPEGWAAGANQVMPSTYFTRNPDAEEVLGDIAEPMFSIGRTF